MVADAVWELVEQPPRPAKASTAAATKYIFTDYLFVTVWFHMLHPACVSRRRANAGGILTLGKSDMHIFDEPWLLLLVVILLRLVRPAKPAAMIVIFAVPPENRS